MKKILTYWDSVVVLIISFLYFGAVHSLSVLFFQIVAALLVLAGLLIFPGKMFLKRRQSEFSVTEKMVYLLSNLTVFALVLFMLFLMYAEKNEFLRVATPLLILLNIACALYFVYRSKEKELLFCICAMFLPGSIMF